MKSSFNSTVNNNISNKQIHLTPISKPIKSIFQLTTVSAVSAIMCGLTGCQSSLALDTPKSHPTQLAMPQLLNMSDNPSSSAMAKTRFVNAIRLHLASEHLSNSVVQYKIRPFVESDSVDADSQSAFETAIKTFVYMSEQKEQASQAKLEAKEGLQEYIDEFKEEIAQAKAEGDTSYDDFTEEDIKEEAEYRYELDSYDDDNESDDDMKDFFRAYSQNKEEQINKILNGEEEIEQSSHSEISDLKNLSDVKMAEEVLTMLRRTPEQIDAMQVHSFNHFRLQMLEHHQPQQKKYNGIISYESSSPTFLVSAQLPYGFDFNKGSATLDPSVILPLAAFFAPTKLSLPAEMESHTVSFSLPEAIREQIPTDVLYTTFLHAVEVAFAEMDSEYFTAVDISDDAYAKQVGAKRAVKIYWGSKEGGEFIGKVIKSMSQDLQSYVTDHPELYEDYASQQNIAEILTAWELVERDFQSKDVGGLLQIIEAIAPVNFHKSTYYYLDSNDQLLSSQAKMSIGSELYGWTMDSVKQTNFDEKTVKSSHLYPLYVEDFGDKAATSINGNDWFKGSSDKQLHREARYARYDYKDWEELEAGYVSPDEAENEEEKRPRNKQEMQEKWSKK